METRLTELEEEVRQALFALQTAVDAMSGANPKPDLMPIFARLDELTAKMPPETERDLLHYLHRKSYQKAAAFLEERRAGRA